MRLNWPVGVIVGSIAIGLLAVSGCMDTREPDEPGQANWLIDITDESGLDFSHDAGVRGAFLPPEIIGSGLAVFDYDDDGALDLYLINSGRLNEPDSRFSNRLYRQAGGRFEDVTEPSGLADTGYGMGAAVGDMDNDGDRDLLVTNLGPNTLFRNNSDGTFTNVTGPAGMTGDEWSTSATFCDLNNDGHLDLFVANYINSDNLFACRSGAGELDYCGPNAYRGVPDQLYRNNGDGTFTDISQVSGVGRVARNGLGVICLDFSGDGLADILVANDGEQNQLWINGGDLTFEDRGLAWGVAVNLFGEAEASMGIAVGDINGDRALDVLMTHLDEESNTLYLNTGQQALVDDTGRSALGASSMPFTGFGTEWFDADHDGHLDLLVANGRVRRGPERDYGAQSSEALTPVEAFQIRYAQTNQFFRTAHGRFEDACGLAPSFCAALEVSRGLLTEDLDRDGDLDVLVTNSNGRARVYRNDVPDPRAAWLMVRAMLPSLNRDAVGGQVQVRAGDHWQIRPVIHTRSYLSSGEATVHFGLGAATAVDEILIIWPDGEQETFAGVAANQVIELRRGQGSGVLNRVGTAP